MQLANSRVTPNVFPNLAPQHTKRPRLRFFDSPPLTQFPVKLHEGFLDQILRHCDVTDRSKRIPDERRVPGLEERADCAASVVWAHGLRRPRSGRMSCPRSCLAALSTI